MLTDLHGLTHSVPEATSPIYRTCQAKGMTFSVEAPYVGAHTKQQCVITWGHWAREVFFALPNPKGGAVGREILAHSTAPPESQCPGKSVGRLLHRRGRRGRGNLFVHHRTAGGSGPRDLSTDCRIARGGQRAVRSFSRGPHRRGEWARKPFSRPPHFLTPQQGSWISSTPT